MADSLWYKEAVVYELNVRAFSDSDGDGIGDFPGLSGRLDYLKDLGVSALWLLPFYPSPLRDDGYDISDYTSVHPAYGTLDDFRALLAQAHRRGLRVITELVLNHTSDQHPWFQRARRAKPGDPARDFYVWSESADRYRDARIIFQDFETSNWTWDPVAGAYFWHRFYAHQPDLNYDHPDVQKAMLEVVDFWLELGVDGLRLDAVPYLFEREGTNCENLPETHVFLKRLRAHVDAKFQDRMLLAEANQWPEDAVAYFGEGRGDECHTAFHFPLMPRMFMALQTEDRFPIVDILEQTPPPPESAQWMLFLRNHDELTLEMVTDEERDYMYRMYAGDPQARINLGIRRRLAPLLGNDRLKIELMNALLLSLPGTPVIYYGDEIGMGDNFYLGDRNGVRTPMQWSADRNAGFSRANSQRLYLPLIIDPEYHYEAVNVDVQQNNTQSLLWWTKRMLALRRRFRVFGRGSIRFVPSENRKVLSFVRRLEDETVLVVANLSRFAQHVELDLSGFSGWTPVEMMGRSQLPKVGDAPYPLTLGPHGFYWFSLRSAAQPEEEAGAPVIAPERAWSEIFADPGLAPPLADALAAMLRRGGWAELAPWHRTARIGDWLPVDGDIVLAVLGLEAPDGTWRSFLCPLSHARGADAERLRKQSPRSVAAQLQGGALLYDSAEDPKFWPAMLRFLARAGRVQGRSGELAASVSDAARGLLEKIPAEAAPSTEAARLLQLSGGGLTLKLFRRIEPGISTELEVTRFLTDSARFEHSPALLGSLEYIEPRREPQTVGVLFASPHREADAWAYTLDHLKSFFERVVSHPACARPAELPGSSLIELSGGPLPDLAQELIGPYWRDADLMGRRVAELHLNLADARGQPAFQPEPFTWHYQRGLYQSMRTMSREATALLRRKLSTLPPASRLHAQKIIDLEEEALKRYRAIHQRRISAQRIRCHGNLHLGRVVYTGKDFWITGFEGDVSLTLAERRIKRTPFWDVAAMLRSFHFASYGALFGRESDPLVRAEDLRRLESWTEYWQVWTCAAFLGSYLQTLGASPMLPASAEEREILLNNQLAERALRELSSTVQSVPDWTLISLKGLARLLESAGLSEAARA